MESKAKLKRSSFLAVAPGLDALAPDQVDPGVGEIDDLVDAGLARLGERNVDVEGSVPVVLIETRRGQTVDPASAAEHMVQATPSLVAD